MNIKEETIELDNYIDHRIKEIKNRYHDKDEIDFHIRQLEERFNFNYRTL